MDENGIHVVAIAQLETSVSQHACAEFAVSNAQVEPNSQVAGITTIDPVLVKSYTYVFQSAPRNQAKHTRSPRQKPARIPR